RRGRGGERACRPGARGAPRGAPQEIHGRTGENQREEAAGESREDAASHCRCAGRRALERRRAGARRRRQVQGCEIEAWRQLAGRACRSVDRSGGRARSFWETDMSNREVVVVAGARTAIGDYGVSLKDFPATKLGAIAIREAVARSKVD